MALAESPPTIDSSIQAGRDEERVLDEVRALALELGGDRAARAVSPTASLERDVGLGSLERVELMARLERAFGRELDDAFLLLDTPREMARALPLVPEVHLPASGRGAAVGPATALSTEEVATLVDALRRRAAAEPARTHVLLHRDAQLQPVTYAELWDGAARIAGALRERGLGIGEPVALMLPTGLDYLQAFMGILAAGGIAVPLYPPARLDRLGEYLQRQSRILANADARFLVAMPEALPVARLLKGSAPALGRTLTVDALRGGEPLSVPPSLTAGDAALVQYTSGSTGDPKGVLLSHANLLANIRAIATGVDMQPTDVGVSWLPLYHDMGLIGTWLACMVQGIPLSLMSPLSFLARPERWLWAIHQQRATLSPAPNFAFELCVRKVSDEAIAGLDLSSWRCALNGSEPVSASTLDRFAERFARYGFRREALMPVYGLAECSVALCFPPLGRGPRVDHVQREPFARDRRALGALPGDAGALSFVSVGTPLPGHEVRIVDEGRREVGERAVGRLLFRGPSCMRGYFHNDDATARAVLADGWIDSGDQAYAAEGEIFITGRLKDLIIKGGRNIVPQEVEEVAATVAGVRKGCVAAFGIPDEGGGTERLVVLAESHAESASERDRLARDVIAAVASGVGVPPDDVRVVPPGVVPKTPSGKIRRGAARAAYLEGRIAGGRVPWRLRGGLAIGKSLGWLRSGGRRAWRGVQAAAIVLSWLLALVALGPVFLVLTYTVPAGLPVRRLSRAMSRVILAASGCRLRVEGNPRLPDGGPLVLVANHASYADTPALLAALAGDFRFVAMREVLTWPLVGALARRGDHPTVERFLVKESVANALAVEGQLRRGEALLFFAEGGFRASRGLRPFRLGAFQAAVATGARVVPVALRGTREVLRDGQRIPHPRPIHVWVGEPLTPNGSDWRAVVDLRDRTVAAIAEHCGEPRLATAPVTRALPPRG
ncbi:MAG: hypothetical protein AMXMBFR55_13990 [Gemmatimonadota bacterium]